MLGWDTTAKRLGFWYWNSDGLVTVGAIEYRKEGIVFPEHYTTPEGNVELSAVWTRLGPDRYRVLQR